MKTRLIRALLPALAIVAGCASMPGAGSTAASPSDSGQLLSIDHYVRVKSTAPASSGQFAQVSTTQPLKEVVFDDLVRMQKIA